jgi:NAD(P)-dependent dehydrogenase (short-subunit alcohol dehydrogenase family)
MAGPLEGKVVIVTGAAQGAGRAIARHLGTEGARVLVADVLDGADALAELRDAGVTARYVRADVTSEDDMGRMAGEAAEAFGGVDCLINNAALYGALERKPWDQVTPEEWQRALAVNVMGCALAARAAVPHMRRRGGGRIVNIASAVVFSAPPNLIHYTATKAAVIGFTRSLARELGVHRITVNAVSPGLMHTPATMNQITAEYLRRALGQRALGREMYPADIAGAIAFLCSDAAGFITGQNLVIDGGVVFN